MTHAISVPGAVPTWTLGDRLTKARMHAGLKQDELATQLGCSRWSVIRYESDQNEPNRATLVAWAVTTGVDLDWLIGSTPRRRRRRSSGDSGGYREWSNVPIEHAA